MATQPRQPMRPWSLLASRPQPADAPAPPRPPPQAPTTQQPSRPPTVRPAFPLGFRRPTTQSQLPPPPPPPRPAAPAPPAPRAPPFQASRAPIAASRSPPPQPLPPTLPSPPPIKVQAPTSPPPASSSPQTPLRTPKPKPFPRSSPSSPTVPRDITAESSSPFKTTNSSPTTTMNASDDYSPAVPAASPKPFTTTTITPDTTATPRQITLPESPKVKHTLAPPSPFNLPPTRTQFKSTQEAVEPKIPSEAEPKRVLVQETTRLDKPNMFPADPSIRADSMKKKYYNTAGAGDGKYRRSRGGDLQKKSLGSSDGSRSARIINISGDNKGALMELGFSPRKHGIATGLYRPIKPHCHHGNNVTGDHGVESVDSGTPPQIPPATAYMNSNVQCINNSIFFNSSCSHHDPGLHFSLSRRKRFTNGNDLNRANGQ